MILVFDDLIVYLAEIHRYKVLIKCIIYNGSKLVRF